MLTQPLSFVCLLSSRDGKVLPPEQKGESLPRPVLKADTMHTGQHLQRNTIGPSVLASTCIRSPLEVTIVFLSYWVLTEELQCLSVVVDTPIVSVWLCNYSTAVNFQISFFKSPSGSILANNGNNLCLCIIYETQMCRCLILNQFVLTLIYCTYV